MQSYTASLCNRAHEKRPTSIPVHMIILNLTTSQEFHVVTPVQISSEIVH